MGSERAMGNIERDQFEFRTDQATGCRPRLPGPPANTVGLLFMVVLLGMGERMAERFLPIYLMALGGGALSIGLLNGMDNLLSALYSFPGGYLADRIGTKRSLLLFNLVAMVGFAIVILVPTWEAVLIGAVFFLSWSAISQPATLSLIHRVLPGGQAHHGSEHAFAGAPHPHGFGAGCRRRVHRWCGANKKASALPLSWHWCWRSWLRCSSRDSSKNQSCQRVGQPAPCHPKKTPSSSSGQMSPDLRGLLVTDILVRFCEQIPYAFVVVWCMKTITAPVSALQFGLLTSIEMATAVLVYIPVAYLADRSAKKPFVAATFAFFTLFPLLLLYCRSFEWLVAAFVLRGLKEFGEPTRKALIMELAPDHCKAGMFGLYYLIRDAFVAVAAVGGAFLWLVSPEVNFLVAFGFGVLGTVGYPLFGREPL